MGKTVRFKVSGCSSGSSSKSMRKFKREHNRKMRRETRNFAKNDFIPPKNTFNEWCSPRDGITNTSPELAIKIEKNYGVNAYYINDHELKVYKNRLMQKKNQKCIK